MALMRQKTNTIGTPPFLQDWTSREHIMPYPLRVDPTQFTDQAGIQLTVSTNTAAGAVVLPVNAISGPILPFGSTAVNAGPLIPAGSLISFPQARIADPTAAPTVNPTGGGASGGSLAAGTYKLQYTIVGSNGESLPSPEVTFTSASTNIPRVTFPGGAPAAGTTYSVYITAAGGASGTETRYASGISGATYDMSIAAPGSQPAAPTVNTTATAKLIRTRADVNVGDTSILVEATPSALVSGDQGIFTRYGTESILAGTPIGRTYAMRDAGLPYVAGDPVNHDEFYITARDIVDAHINPDVEAVRPGTVILENYLPNYSNSLLTSPTIADPNAGPTVTAVGVSGGTLPPGTYQVGYTIVDGGGESLISPLGTVNVSAGQAIEVGSIAFVSGQTSMNFYVSTGPNASAQKLQGTITAAAPYVILSPGTGANPPGSKTSTAANPTTAPTVSAAGGGVLPSGSYYVAYSYLNNRGETKISPATQINVVLGQDIVVAPIALPAGVTGINYYLSVGAGQTQLARVKNNGDGTQTTITSIPFVAAGTPPQYNTTGGSASAILNKLRSVYRCIIGVD